MLGLDVVSACENRLNDFSVGQFVYNNAHMRYLSKLFDVIVFLKRIILLVVKQRPAEPACKRQQLDLD